MARPRGNSGIAVISIVATDETRNDHGFNQYLFSMIPDPCSIRVSSVALLFGVCGVRSLRAVRVDLLQALRGRATDGLVFPVADAGEHGDGRPGLGPHPAQRLDHLATQVD